MKNPNFKMRKILVIEEFANYTEKSFTVSKSETTTTTTTKPIDRRLHATLTLFSIAWDGHHLLNRFPIFPILTAEEII